MYGKPYHKMPLSSWMIPGGNRDQKRKLMKEEKYPMMSAIQRNLGGPLSDVFFSCLTPTQQDHIGYTPKLAGPGSDLWVSPSDILVGKVVLTPPFTSRLRQALTHQGIIEMGAEIEKKVQLSYEVAMEDGMRQRERDMRLEVDRLIRDAVQADRAAQRLINNEILEKATSDLSIAFQETLGTCVTQVLEEGLRRLEEAVDRTRREMEEELCAAVNSRSEYLAHQYQFQLKWRDTELMEKYENLIKKHQQNCSAAMKNVQQEFEDRLKQTVVKLEAEHITDLVLQGSELSQSHHVEKKVMETNFEGWFVKYFEDEIGTRDFNIVDLENKVRDLEAKCSHREVVIEQIFKHFQRFINFALKEKPGQAEFLLSLTKELDKLRVKEKSEEEVELIARMILDYILKTVDVASKKREKITGEPSEDILLSFTQINFREKLNKEKEEKRNLKIVGETESTVLSQKQFMVKQLKSLSDLFKSTPSLLPVVTKMLQEKGISIKESDEFVC